MEFLQQGGNTKLDNCEVHVSLRDPGTPGSILFHQNFSVETEPGKHIELHRGVKLNGPSNGFDYEAKQPVKHFQVRNLRTGQKYVETVPCSGATLIEDSDWVENALMVNTFSVLTSLALIGSITYASFIALRRVKWKRPKLVNDHQEVVLPVSPVLSQADSLTN